MSLIRVYGDLPGSAPGLIIASDAVRCGQFEDLEKIVPERAVRLVAALAAEILINEFF